MAKDIEMDMEDMDEDETPKQSHMTSEDVMAAWEREQMQNLGLNRIQRIKTTPKYQPKPKAVPKRK